MSNKQDEDTEEVLLLVDSGVPVDEIADELELSSSRVYQILHSKEALARLRDMRDQEIIKDYVQRDSGGYKAAFTMEHICRKHGLTRTTLYRILDKHGIPHRRKTVKPIDNEAEVITTMYSEGSTLEEIRRATKRSISYIYKVLDRQDVSLRSDSHTPTIVIDTTG